MRSSPPSKLLDGRTAGDGAPYRELPNATTVVTREVRDLVEHVIRTYGDCFTAPAPVEAPAATEPARSFPPPPAERPPPALRPGRTGTDPGSLVRRARG